MTLDSHSKVVPGSSESPRHRHALSAVLLLLALVVSSVNCSGNPDSARLTDTHVVRSTAASLEPRRIAPETVTVPVSFRVRAGSTPLTAIVRVMLSGDGTVGGVQLREVSPANDQQAEQLGEELVAAVWDWRYHPSDAQGLDVLDLTFVLEPPDED